MNNMIKVKQILLILLFSFVSFSSLMSANLKPNDLINPFPSEENLSNFEKVDNVLKYDKTFIDSLQISLITISPGKPLYSWFGHSAIMVTQGEDTSIIFDYGVFNFNSDNFYKNFILGKMYYSLVPSPSEYRLALPKEDEREITKTVLNLSDEDKLNVLNFLNFNIKSENSTYLYDFYLDNCATRIRDIISWTTDNDFKKWATNKETPYTFRNLSTQELERSLFVNWVLNSFLGRNTDDYITVWDTMFLPQYLEKAIYDYEKVNTSVSSIYKSENSTKFNSKSPIKQHLLTYTLIGLILGGIALFLKTQRKRKKKRILGIYNSIIIFFLLVISSCITFLNFFSNIPPAWFNENILFLNPVIYTILFVLSLQTISQKRNATKKMIRFERASIIYTMYLLVYFFTKLLIPSVLFQQNFIIIIPILLFFSFQIFIRSTQR